MDPARHLAILRVESSRLASMPADRLTATVPTVPDWDLERVVRHTGKVHRWVTTLLAAPPEVDALSLGPSAGGLPRGPACLPAYREAADELIAALEDADPARPVASFSGVGNVAFWIRRQAHEATVHRMDAADAVQATDGTPPDPIARDGAIDGIDEWLHVFVATRHQQKGRSFDVGLLGRRLILDAGEGATWAITFAEGERGGTAIESASAGDSADVELSGTPEAMLLVCWRRRGLECVRVSGDATIAEAFHESLRF